ncbi:hypothetical protein I546_4429 [Mycobacterium kansasii 732]|nr:hypothetical protein I546_4429 [Mycobacterium kansasii 732]
MNEWHGLLPSDVVPEPASVRTAGVHDNDTPPCMNDGLLNHVSVQQAGER